MRIDYDPAKERANVREHGLDFSFPAIVFGDPPAMLVYDRYQDGEERWRTFAEVLGTLLLVAHTFPDPDDEDWVRVIGLRKATPTERRHYEQGSFA